MPNSGQNWPFFILCDLEIWQMTLENITAPHLTYFKLCASFHNHRSIRTVATVRKCQIRVKISIFCPLWPWNLIDDLENQWGTSSMLLQAVCMISLPYVISNWSYSPETAKLGFDLCDLDLWPLTLTFCMNITSVHGNNSWKFHDDGNIVKQVWRTDRRTDRLNQSACCS